MNAGYCVPRVVGVGGRRRRRGEASCAEALAARHSISIPVNARTDLINILPLSQNDSRRPRAATRARRLQRGRRAERRAGHDVLDHFVAEVWQIVHVNDGRQLTRGRR